jgi:hypothetical protein
MRKKSESALDMNFSFGGLTLRLVSFVVQYISHYEIEYLHLY